MPALALSRIPDLLGLHRRNPQRYPFLLQTLGGDKGWDILFAFPREQLPYFYTPGSPAFLEQIDRLWRQERGDASSGVVENYLPFRGGWFVYLGYELLHQLEPSVSRRGGDENFPLGWLARIPAAVLVDRCSQRAWLMAESSALDCLGAMEEDVAEASPFPCGRVGVCDLEEEASQLFLDGVARIKAYIREGDVFQVNLARRWQARLSAGSKADLYAALRERNPAPFAGLADFGLWGIVSSSPERLLRVRDGMIETRPIAGTHPRAASPEEDNKLRQALISSAKEQAEHIMLVDLERNDLGRICTPGSVVVDELMAVRSYAHVHHIESSVRGRLAEGVSPGGVLRALFPGGTITGCPKVRTMQIISELEASPRLAYTGSMGYLNRDGGMDLNILIRSFMVSGEELSFKAGAGIVADSDPDRELAETRAKAKGLLRALETS